jgi:hypothetical protein
MELEQQAILAQKACEISRNALAHLTDGIGEADPAVLELIEEVRSGVFVANGEEICRSRSGGVRRGM